MAFVRDYLLLRGECTPNGAQKWAYRDTVAPSAIAAAGYLAMAAGMRIGDRVEYTRTNNQATPTSVVATSEHVCVSRDADGLPTLSEAITSSAESEGVTITLAASATANGMDISVQVEDGLGNALVGVFQLEMYMSEAATGLGLTADAYSGDLTATVGTIQETVTAKKHWRIQTNASGLWTGTLVDTAHPADQYVVIKDPDSAGVFVSVVSGTNWQGV